MVKKTQSNIRNRRKLPQCNKRTSKTIKSNLQLPLCLPAQHPGSHGVEGPDQGRRQREGGTQVRDSYIAGSLQVLDVDINSPKDSEELHFSKVIEY